MNTEKRINEILYSDGGPYISAIPVIFMAGLFDAFNKLIGHLVKNIDRHAQKGVGH